MGTKIDWANLSGQTIEDRREGKRIKLRYEIEACGADGEGATFSIHARTRDVSHQGCCLELERRVSPGDLLTLKVFRRNSSGVIECTSAVPFRISWIKKEGEIWVAGAEMVEQERPWGVKFPRKTPHGIPS